ncbi:hypothetical protein [Thiobaca trueperi]|uniref:hypothetical protein n=1 Tax=Thiobaca trueperi TaxID=127458 RepID=UPI0014045151|nr:hypothetical protein [Thiobaca trueperi]
MDKNDVLYIYHLKNLFSISVEEAVNVVLAAQGSAKGEDEYTENTIKERYRKCKTKMFMTANMGDDSGKEHLRKLILKEHSKEYLRVSDQNAPRDQAQSSVGCRIHGILPPLTLELP